MSVPGSLCPSRPHALAVFSSLSLLRGVRGAWEGIQMLPVIALYRLSPWLFPRGRPAVAVPAPPLQRSAPLPWGRGWEGHFLSLSPSRPTDPEVAHIAQLQSLQKEFIEIVNHYAVLSSSTGP